VHLTKRKQCSSKLLYNHIIDSIFIESPKKFQELQDIIFSAPDLLDESRISYLR
jgi:hypothetical protein